MKKQDQTSSKCCGLGGSCTICAFTQQQLPCSSTTLGLKSSLGSDVTHGYTTFRGSRRQTAHQPTSPPNNHQRCLELASVLAGMARSPDIHRLATPDATCVGKKKLTNYTIVHSEASSARAI
jgi:hypothetical protein